MIWCRCCQVFRVVTYCCQGYCVNCLLYKTLCSAEYFVDDASIVRDCNQDFLAILNQSLPNSIKIWSSTWIEFPNNLFLSKVTSNLTFVPLVQECFQLGGCSHENCSVVIDDSVLGSYVLQWKLSLLLDLTQWLMTAQLRCVLLSLLYKWRGSTIPSRYVAVI